MFCGEAVLMHCEEDAHAHMRVCSALQEQLSGTDQFTIPKVLRDKGVTVADMAKKAKAEEDARNRGRGGAGA